MPVAVGCSSELRTGVLNYVEVCELRSVTCESECDSDICELDSESAHLWRVRGPFCGWERHMDHGVDCDTYACGLRRE